MPDAGTVAASQGSSRGNVFYALVPPPAAVAGLSEAVQRARREADRADRTDRADRIAWVAPPRWHVTVRFLGPVDRIAALEREVRLPPAPVLGVAGAGTFGDRVLWAGVTGPLEQLVRAVGGDPEGYAAHLTIGRARGRQGWRGLHRVARALTYPAASWRPAELLLLRSVPGRDYERLAAWPLE